MGPIIFLMPYCHRAKSDRGFHKSVESVPLPYYSMTISLPPYHTISTTHINRNGRDANWKMERLSKGKMVKIFC